MTPPARPTQPNPASPNQAQANTPAPTLTTTTATVPPAVTDTPAAQSEGNTPNQQEGSTPASGPAPRPRKADCSLLYAGDNVYLPDEPSCHFLVYPVKPGETLARIARHFKRNAKAVCAMEENGHLRNSNTPDRMRKWLEELQAAEKPSRPKP